MEWIPLIAISPYLFLFLYIYRHLLRADPYSPDNDPGILVSVIVPCRNEQKNIKGVLDSLAAQSYPSGLFRVIIADDHSDDSTFSIASSYTRLANLKVIRNEGSGKKDAIRTGIRYSEGDLIITTDADCRMDPWWIRTIASYYSDFTPGMIICPVVLQGSSGFFGRFQELEFLGLQGITAGTALAGHPSMCNGANLSFTRALYSEHLADLRSDIPSGDDIFLLQSVKRGGRAAIKWLESPLAAVTTSSSPNLIHFIRQRARWISKAGSYRDRFTIMLAAVTFFTILLELYLLTAAIISPGYLLTLLMVFAAKSVPDFLILTNSARRYAKPELMRWFLPAQIIYPFYVVAVTVYSVFFADSGSFSYPSPKGT